MLQILDRKVIKLQGSMLGFDHLDEFYLQTLEENSPFGLLQSKEDANIGFIVASPFNFHKEYEFVLDEKEKETLQISSNEDVLVLVTITLQDPFRSSTMNLLAPVIINVKSQIGRQIVLLGKYEYDTKTPLFANSLQESGEGKC